MFNRAHSLRILIIAALGACAAACSQPAGSAAGVGTSRPACVLLTDAEIADVTGCDEQPRAAVQEAGVRATCLLRLHRVEQRLVERVLVNLAHGGAQS